MDDCVIKIENLVKYFDGRCVLDDIDLNIPRGCIYGLLGRNGIGKTTIIRILLGLDFPTRGQTFLLGNDSQNLPAKIRVLPEFLRDRMLHQRPIIHHPLIHDEAQLETVIREHGKGSKAGAVTGEGRR